MIDLATLALAAITLGFIILTLGIALLSQGMDSLSYNSNDSWNTGHNANAYHRNPLYTLNSKWFHYRPKGAVVVSKKQWADIEKNIGIKIAEAKSNGIILGRSKLLKEIEAHVKEEKSKAFPSSPYSVLGVASTTPLEDVEAKYRHMKAMYDPKNFVDLDLAFIQLAQIRIKQLDAAWNQINLGIGRSKGNI